MSDKKNTVKVTTIIDGKLTSVETKATSTVDMNKQWEQSYRDNYTEDLIKVTEDGKVFIKGIEQKQNKDED